MADDNGPPMTIAMVVLTIVSLLFMVLRFYCKQALSTKLGLDDIVLGVSWVRLLWRCKSALLWVRLTTG